MEKRWSRRFRGLACALLLALTLPLWAGVARADMSSGGGTVMKTLQAGPYALKLTIGPLQQMFSQAQVKEKHPKDGEVMVRGTMTMSGMGGMGMGNHHLELQVLQRSTRKPVSNAMVAITITTPSGKVLQHVPIAVMYGIKEGPSDLHYGNNVDLKPGHYHVQVQVEHTSAVFDVTLAQGMQM